MTIPRTGPIVLTLLLIACSTYVDSLRADDDQPRADGSLSVMTYNIERGLHTPGAFTRILGLLKRRSPDVVCLQEVSWRTLPNGETTGQASHVAEALGGHDWRATTRRSSTGPVVLVRGKITHSEPLVWSDKIAYGLLVRAVIDGRSVIVVSLHLRSLGSATVKGAMKTEPQRVAEIRHLLERLERESLPVIIAGDFNALPLFPSIVLLARRFSDVAGHFGDNAHTRETHRLPARIDYIFLSKHFTPQAYAVLPVDYSDHRPVTAQVHFAPAAAERATSDGP